VRADGERGGGDGGGGGGCRGRGAAGDVGLGAGLVGGADAVVAGDVDGFAVEGVDAALETAVFVAMEPDGLADFDKWDVGAGVGEGATEAVGGGVRLHGGAGGLHGAVAEGDGGVDEVVVADQEAWRGAGDGGSWAGTVSAGGVVAGFVGHGQDEVRRESGGLGGDAEVGLVDGAVMARIATDAPRCLRRYEAPVDTHGREGVDERVVFDLGAAVCQCGVGAAPNTKPGDKEDSKHGLASHGGNEAAEAEFSVKARNVEDLREVGADLEGVEGGHPVECERPRGQGVSWAAGQVREALAGDAGGGHLAEGGDVRRGKRRGWEGAEEGFDAGVDKLAVGESQLVAGKVNERGRRWGWRRGSVM